MTEHVRPLIVTVDLLSQGSEPVSRPHVVASALIRVFHVSMRYWPLADKSDFRGVGNQPWQP